MTLRNTSSYQRPNDYHRARSVQRVLQRATQTTANMLIHTQDLSLSLSHTHQQKSNVHQRARDRNIPSTKDEGSNKRASNTVTLTPQIFTEKQTHFCQAFHMDAACTLHHLHKRAGQKIPQGHVPAITKGDSRGRELNEHKANSALPLSPSKTSCVQVSINVPASLCYKTAIQLQFDVPDNVFDDPYGRLLCDE